MKEKCPKCGIGSTWDNGVCRNGGCGYKRPSLAVPVFFVVSALVALWLFTPTSEKAPTKVSQAILEDNWIAKGEETVRKMLKDPESAQFRGTFFNRGGTNTPVACGEVNAKNSYGGYNGFSRFISAGRPEFTFLEGDNVKFDELWAELCL